MTIINAVKKERKGKGLLYLIAIAVLISLVFISCGDKPTGMADFVDLPEEVNPGEKPTTGETTGSTATITQDDIDKLGTKSSGDLVGYYFESASYNKNGGGTFTFKVQVLKMPDGAGNQFNALKFTGYDASGNKIERIYDIGSPQKYNTDNRYFIPRPYSGTTKNAAATFYNGGKLIFQPDDFEKSIELALKKKSTTDITAQ